MITEAAFTQLSNGSVLLVLRNLGGKGEGPRFKNGTRPLFHNPRCADNGICKAFSRSDDHVSTHAIHHLCISITRRLIDPPGACELYTFFDRSIMRSGPDME